MINSHFGSLEGSEKFVEDWQLCKYYMLKTSSIQSDKILYFGRSIEQTCKLFKYYETMFGYYPHLEQ